MVFSMRIVNSDFYIAAPIPDLDVCNSTFRETAISKVPIIRIYGATPSGQKTCLHVHGVFPYIYVPYDGTKPSEKYMKQLAISVDFAVQVSLGKASSSRQHVYEISLVKGIPFYGYHEGERDFLKISLYNPFLVTRVVSLLQNGAVMNKVFQPHEAHIPYLLQFLMDHNLYGMNLLHASAAKFRNPVRLVDGDGEAITMKSLAETQRVKSPVTFFGTPNQMWNEDTVPREWILGPEVERVSFCELEVDALASDILNKREIGVNLGTNPGLAAIWEDEQQRRRDANESSQISGPSSQDRGLIQETETERNLKERIKEIIDERDLLIQSQMGKLGRGALSPQELASFQDSICTLAAASQKGLAADDDSLDADVMSQLLSQHVQGTLGEGAAAQSSQVIVDEDEPVVNQSIVQEVVEASQMSVSPELSSTMDKEMINILASLAEEPTQPGSQRTASQSIILDTGDSLSDEEAKDEEDLSEAEESIVMSQRVWDDIEHHSLGSGEEQMADEQGNGKASQGASQFNLEGMSDTWIGSFLEGDIPQLDGAVDESSDGHEEFRKTRKRLGMGRTKTRSSRLISESKKPGVSTTSEIPLTEPLHSEEAEKHSGHGERTSEMASECSDASEEIKRSTSEDVWPKKGTAIRTYSKRTRSSLKVQKSLRLSEEKDQKKEEEEVVEFKTEEEEKPDLEDTFRLFLSESSGSEDNTTGTNSEPGESELSSSEQNRKLGFEQVKARKLSTVRKGSNAVKSSFGLEEETEVVKQKDLNLEVEKSDQIETCAASNERVAFYDDFPDITKHIHSHEKNLKGGDKGQKVATQCLSSSVPSTSHKTLGLLAITQAVPSTSSSVQKYSRKVTLRNRKLSDIEKEELKLGKGKAACEKKLKSDLVSPLGAISGAMPNLRVSLEDVSQSQMLDSKFSKARARLRHNRETPHQSYTLSVNQVLNSPVAKEGPSLKRSPVVTRTKERAPLLKRTSPKRKEEKIKKYGTLPVVIAKSPKKSPADNSQGSQASPANRQIGAASLVRTSQIYEDSTVSTDVFSSVRKGGDNSLGSASSRSRTLASVDNNDENFQRFMECSSSETPVTSVTCSGGDGKISRHRTGSVPSRQVSLKLTNRSGDTRRTLSLERKGLKRKLKVDFQGQQTPVRDLPGSGKKRKLSLTLKASSISFPRMDDVSETLVTSDEEYVVKEGKSVFKDQDNTSSSLQIQQARIDTGSDDGGSGFDGKKEFAMDRSLLEVNVTCVPSSPGEPNSGDEVSPKCSKSSLAVTRSDSLAGLIEACPSNSKSPDILKSHSFAKMGLKTTVNVSNDVELVSQEFDFPNEKDTELLANALFNMSFPSPLPCVEECCSPPCPLSPLKANCHEWKGNQVLTVNSSCAEEDNALEVEETNESPEFSYLDQVKESQSSPVVHSMLEGYVVVPTGPQLGETQSHGDNTEAEITNYVGQRISENKKNEESFKPLRIPINRSDLRSNGEEFLERKGAIGGGEDNSESSISGNNCCKSEIVTGSESNESPGLMARDSVVMPPFDTEMTDLADLTEAEEPSKLSLKEENSIVTRQLSAQGNSDNNEMEIFLGEGKEEQVKKTSSRVPSAEKSEFVLKLSLEEENSNEAQPLSAQGNVDDNEMEISSGEGKETQVEKTSSKQLTSSLAAKIPTESFRYCKEQTLSKVLSVSASVNDAGSCRNRVVIKPLKEPPSSEELLNSLTKYGLPHCKYQEPFCSNPDDIPVLPREVGGRILRIESKQVSNLPEFESSSSSQGLKHWRMVMSSTREFAVQNICQSMEDAASICKNAELKIALMGDGEVVITPCRDPPSLESVKAWARTKLAKRSIKALKKVEDKPLKKQEQIKEPPKDLKLLNVEKELVSGHKESNVKAFNISTTEQGPVTLPRPAPKETLPEVTRKVSSQPVQTALVRAEVDKQNVMELSDSFSPVEITSPCSLFSPNEGKMFTFVSGTHPGMEIRKSHDKGEKLGTHPGMEIRKSHDKGEKLGSHPEMEIRKSHDKGEKLGTQPKDMRCRDPEAKLEKVAVTSGASTVTVTPSIFRSPEQTPSSTQQPLSPLLQTQNSVFSGPHHSTPVATKLVYGVQSPRCTPISNATTQRKRLDANVETSEKKTTPNQASTDQTPSLRQQLLASQFKFVTPGAPPRRAMPWSSQIEGPSPNNTYGFKVPQMNLQDAKALHEVQHLTLFSLELHVRTRRDVRPDPEFDPICAIFYYIQTDTPLPSGKNKVTGILCVDSESAKLYTPGRDTKEKSLYNAEDTTKRSPHKDAVASTSTSNTSMSRTSQNTSTFHSRTLISRSGVTDYEVQYVAEEKDLFPALLLIIRKWDPDILIGYEVQMFSWGFLLERALTFEIDLCSRLARVQGSSSDSNMDAEKDRWGAAHTSEIKIAGRIILNVWRLMRHEVTLSSYSFENIAFHVLHERIPLFTFRTLSDWWDHRTALNRWRTIDHYVRRCRVNVRILEAVDFIGRTSELARLFGILFFSVISRGSQYRVESMMLRIAKPMNYIPVSPSVEQRGAMRAPETIPLVMEPESRFYSDPVLVLDFQSLYPTMIIAYNYCFSTCLGRVSCLSEYGEFKFGATSLCVPPSLLKKLEGDIHVSPNGVAYVKPSVRRGILPSMLDEILQTRIMVKTSMKKWKNDKSLGRMLDARQLGLKLIANVTFGYTSAHFSGRMPCVEIGDSIVRKARETLERAIDLVNNTPRWGARVVYGDTDSLFVLLKGATKEEAFSIGKDIVDTVTAMNPKPVKLKFEKVYLPCVLQTKKRYVGYMYETLDQKEPVFDAKGIETVRRDSCPAVAKILEKSLRTLFETRDLSLVKKYVQRQCSKLMEGRASIQDFTFAKEYRGMKSYKPGACVPALELTRRMLREDRRSEPRVGERVPYVVVYGSPGLPLIQLVRRPHEVLQDPGLRLNASYYITKQILPPLNRVFALIGMDVFTWYAELPRVVRVAQLPSVLGDKKKGTISQYFSTMTCPVCQELTPADICSKCRAQPQMSAVTLMNRMRGWERTHQHLSEICYSCSGSRDSKLCCVSLDCPVFYKLVQYTRDLKSSQHLRKILESF